MSQGSRYSRSDAWREGHRERRIKERERESNKERGIQSHRAAEGKLAAGVQLRWSRRVSVKRTVSFRHITSIGPPVKSRPWHWSWDAYVYNSTAILAFARSHRSETRTMRRSKSRAFPERFVLRSFISSQSVCLSVLLLFHRERRTCIFLPELQFMYKRNALMESEYLLLSHVIMTLMMQCRR